MGQFVSYSLPSRADCSPVNRLLPPIYCQSRRNNDLLGEFGDENAPGGDDFEAKFRTLFAYFEDARKLYETRLKNATNGNEADCRINNLEKELKVLKRQLSALGDLLDQFLDTSLAMRERTRRMEGELGRRLERLEAQNAQLRANLEAMGQQTHKNGGNELRNEAEQTIETIHLDELSIADEIPLEQNVQQQLQPPNVSNCPANDEGGGGNGIGDELAQFLAGLPPVDELGQLVLNKFKYSCEFAQLLYTGGGHVDSVFCNIFSGYPPTFFEELVEYALTTHRPDALVRRICVWLAADEPWPDMATLFPSAVQRRVSNDRVLYEFQNIGKSCGQQQHKLSEFVLRIRAPSRPMLFRAMSNFSLTRK
ncbi:hypothetical protein niasHS_006542 [Heterodera schachtii]|uniref:Uncharacterized protein n=1 Tax=Heterodera schachtii TaxID=97005 RepID=A0ABD2JHI7_HETSC